MKRHLEESGKGRDLKGPPPWTPCERSRNLRIRDGVSASCEGDEKVAPTGKATGKMKRMTPP
jgi:hypothetical protein